VIRRSQLLQAVAPLVAGFPLAGGATVLGLGRRVRPAELRRE
jgi:hypothetical protein